MQQLDLLLGQVLKERYQLTEYLSSNSGRKTFLAQDLQTEELVILKLISFGMDFSWQDFKLFEREAETLQSLSHPAIPCYLDSFEVDLPYIKSFAIVQTYIPGKSLDKYVKDGRVFSESDLRELAKNLLNILIYLHSHCPPVIHRDIKPSNIVLTNRSGNSLGEVYLVDFGSVQTFSAKPAGSFTVTGTYGYMPPEQFGGRAVPASDLYSLGGTLIYLITGIHPGDLPQKDLKLDFEPLAKNISRSLVNWLKLMTEPSLDRRFSSAEKALEQLDSPSKTVAYTENSVNNIVCKPKKTDISLDKHQNLIEIIIPHERCYIHQNRLISFLIWLSILGIWLRCNPIAVLIFDVIAYCAIASIALLTDTVLTIDSEEIYLSHYSRVALGKNIRKPFRFLLKKTPKEKIVEKAALALKDSKQNISNICLVNCLHKTQDRENFYQIIEIFSNENRFISPPLSLEEGTWLINELSAWLNLPIEVRSQITKR